MRLIVGALVAAVLTVPAAQADEPTEACSPLSCVSADAHVELACGANGRDPTACAATLTYAVAFESPLPIESMRYLIAIACSEPCESPPPTVSQCGWAPPEVRPPGETGCSLSDAILLSFTAEPPPGGCQDYAVAIVVNARTVIDPLPTTQDSDGAVVEVCDEP